MARSSEKNASLFRALQEPHKSSQVADEAIRAFLDEVGAAREKHHIAEVMTVCGVRYLGTDGEEVDAMVHHFYGDQMHAEATAAYAYGRFAQQRQELISHVQRAGLRSQAGKP